MLQPATVNQEPEYAAFIAIDWADRKHAWCMEIPGRRERSRGTLEHTPEAIAAWAGDLGARFEGRPIAIGLEQSRGALLYALSMFGQFVLYPIHPTMSARYRNAMFPSGATDDPRDAEALLDLLVRHRERLRPLQPDTEQTRKLQMLVEKRRQLVNQRTEQTNRITDLLKSYFPQVLSWFDGVETPVMRAFLQRWPTLQRLQEENPDEVRTLLNRHRCRPERTEQRLEAMAKARPITSDAAVIEPAAMMVGILLPLVASLQEGIATMEQAIEAVAVAHPDYAIFASFPGAGPVMAPRLLAAFGTLRERFASADEVLSYSGIAPVIERSGETQFWVHFRRACPKFLRQSFHEFAACSIPHCEWAAEHYRRQKTDKDKGHHAAVRSLAFKWVRILYRCWKDRTPYEESVHVVNLATRRPPVDRTSSDSRCGKSRRKSVNPKASTGRVDRDGTGRPTCGNPVNFQWKTEAGFSKFSGIKP